MNCKSLLAFILTVSLGVFAQDKLIGVPLKEISDDDSLNELRQRFAECKTRDNSLTMTSFAKATLEMTNNIQKTVDELTKEYKVYDVPSGIGFGAWDYVFSSNMYYLIYKKIDIKHQNQKMYTEYQQRTREFYHIVTEAIDRELRLTLMHLKQPIPIFRSTPDGLTISAVGCTSLGTIVAFVEAARPLLRAQDFRLRFLRDFKYEWGVE